MPQQEYPGSIALFNRNSDGNLQLTGAELLQLACAIARVGAIICDVGKVGAEQRYGLVDENPYIWDLKED